MPRDRLFRSAAAAVAAMAAIPLSAPAFAQGAGCDVPVEARPAKKRGIGGLLGAVRRSGLEGSIAGALRGDGDLKSDLQGAAQRAAFGAAEEAVRAEACKELASEASPGEPAASSLSQPGPVPSPANPPFPRSTMIPADKQAEFAAYDALGLVQCTGCEGGRSNQGWFQLMLMDQYGGHRDRIRDAMIGWAPGEGAQWHGTEVDGSITAQGETVMGGFRCKTFRLEIVRGNQSAGRDTWLCWGRANQYAGRESWVEVH